MSRNCKAEVKQNAGGNADTGIRAASCTSCSIKAPARADCYMYTYLYLTVRMMRGMSLARSFVAVLARCVVRIVPNDSLPIRSPMEAVNSLLSDA
jgi:hypothetical protein